ncbi:VWA domain-containing protein [Streptomyces sp. SKN60]|uniref:VWA domain-containing protein n=1 Tax=Streptomyces sp. SKN60 TaxID=2855506 RepID=UPI0022467DEB|nr:VWA domain-containing protein [Streptomyces sp. SKN60]MCX2179273.1 VWA domain-containing protein [Streptomyces sp. SKN60]
MGIRSLLRKVFGRDRANGAESEVPETAASVVPAQATSPEAEPVKVDAEPAAEAVAETVAEAAPVPAPVVAEAPAEPELAPEPEAKPETPAQRAAADLVAAAFDNPQIPQARRAGDEVAEAVAEAAEPEVVAEAEPEAAEQEAEAEPEVEPEAAEPVAEVAPESEPVQEEPEAEVAPEPAPVQEEPEAEVAPEPAPVQEQEEEPAPAEEPVPAVAGKPALSLAKVKAAAPHLSDAYKAAGTVLKKQGLTGARAAVYLVVDRSGSMRPYFKDGSVQRLAEQTVALAAHLSEDAAVTTVFFSTDIDGTAELTPAELTPTRLEEINATLGRLGRTNYHRAVEEVLALHDKSADPTRPALVIFQTDGAPESKTAATQALTDAAERPDREIHWRFTVWGEEDGKAFDYLRKLATPRTGVHFAGATPVETAHTAFYRGVLADWSL